VGEEQRASIEGQALSDFALERFTPGTFGPKTAYEHWSRYLFALPWVRGRDVLDYGCGTGFGSRLLAEAAREVLAVDRAPGAIAYAEEHHSHPRCRFEPCDALPTALPAASRDVVVCFEVIEHLHEQRELLGEFRRILRPDGVLLVSTPDPAYTAGLGDNPYHVREMPRDEFVAMVGEFFTHRQVLVQTPVVGEAIAPEAPGENAGSLRVLGFDAASNTWSPVAALPGPPQTYVVVASQQPLADAAACIVSDRDGRLVSDLEAYVTQLEGERTHLTSIIERERQEASAREAELRTREQQAAEAQAQAALDLAAAREEHAAALAAVEATVAARDRALAELQQVSAAHARSAEIAREALAQAERDVRRLRNDVVYLERKVGLRYVSWMARGAAQRLRRLTNGGPRPT
jgi:2-polyprenyl-3-methyl-5-hydroxy-6-metoxy-1,4-benzoquinol methylase